MVAHFYLEQFRNNIVAVGRYNRNGVAVIRNRIVVAERFDLTP